MIRVVVLSTLLLSPAAATVAADEPSASVKDAAPMVVTSDTDAYCESLSRQIDQQGEPLPQAVVFLRNQGRHLCAQGEVRSGINRLRRALMVLRETGNSGAIDSGVESGQ